MIIAFLVGAFLGAVLGVTVLALCIAAKDGDE